MTSKRPSDDVDAAPNQWRWYPRCDIALIRSSFTTIAGLRCGDGYEDGDDDCCESGVWRSSERWYRGGGGGDTTFDEIGMAIVSSGERARELNRIFFYQSCLASTTWSMKIELVKDLYESMSKNWTARRDMIDAVRVLRLDSIDSLDGDPIRDATTVDATIRSDDRATGSSKNSLDQSPSVTEPWVNLVS